MKFLKKLKDFNILNYLLNNRYDSVALKIEQRRELIQYNKDQINFARLGIESSEASNKSLEKEIEKLELNLRKIEKVLEVV